VIVQPDQVEHVVTGEKRTAPASCAATQASRGRTDRRRPRANAATFGTVDVAHLFPKRSIAPWRTVDTR